MTISLNGTSGITFPNNSVQSAAALGTGAVINAVGTSPLTLTSASSQYQVAQIASATNNYVTLPDATTVVEGFPPFVIENRSPLNTKLEVRNSAGTTVGYIGSGAVAQVYLTDNATSAGIWKVSSATQVDAIFKINDATITSTTTSPVANVDDGIIGLSPTSFVRWWTVQTITGSTSTSWTFYTQACTISGNTITVGSTQSVALQTFTNGASIQTTYQNQKIYPIYLSSTSFVLYHAAQAAYNDGNYFQNQSSALFRVCTVSGTTVTFGTSTAASLPSYIVGTLSGTNWGYPSIMNAVMWGPALVRLSDTSFAVVYNDTLNTAYIYPYCFSGSLSCQVVTVSGTTLTVGTKVSLATSTYTQPLSLATLSSTSFLVVYAQGTTGGAAVGRTKMVVVSVSGTTPTFNSPVTIESSDAPSVFNANDTQNMDAAVAPSTSSILFNGGYFTGLASVSGTTPTFTATVMSSRVAPLYLATSTRAWSAVSTGIKGYFDISSSGAAYSSNAVAVSTSVSAVLRTPLGAQPTTAFIASDGSSANAVVKMFTGTTT